MAPAQLGATTVALLPLLVSFVLSAAGPQRLTVAPDRGTSVNISRTQALGPACEACLASSRPQHCSSSVLFTDQVPGTVEFKCPTPQKLFRVEIFRSIDCNAKSCRGHVVQEESDASSLLAFDRRFTWNLEASSPNAVRVEFSKAGLRQIPPSSACPDDHTFTLEATGNVLIGKYCRGGGVRSVQILDRGRLSVEVPAGRKLQRDQFDVSVGEEIKSFVKIKVSLPKEKSALELLSPNYPDSFPDDDVIEWFFEVKPTQAAEVQVLDLVQPRCLKKEAALGYHGRGRGTLVLGLTDKQPVMKDGDFSLMLTNCEMDLRRAGSRGLSLKFKVSTSRASSPVLCNVDLKNMGGLSLRVKKRSSTSDCEMTENSKPTEESVLTSGTVTQLSFQDCRPEDLEVSAMKVIGCDHLKECPKPPISLSVPTVANCLPAPLSKLTWTLRPPQHGTAELTSAGGPLRQVLPGQPCNDSIIRLWEDDGTTIGDFCAQGAIQKVQIHTNVSVTLSRVGGKELRSSGKPIMTACFKGDISERYIFTVSPKKDVPVLLATPGWPAGMKSYSTASWIAPVPPKMEAQLMFSELSQPKCGEGHTSIRVQRFDRVEEDYSRREDEEAESNVVVAGSFYLNMSNCMPENGNFNVLVKITLQKCQNRLLYIILSVVAVLLLIFLVVLAVVCVVIRKKKKKLNREVSIYNPNGASFLPGQGGFPKSREDNESHVYASIEDSLVYTHLLRKGAEMGIYGETDTYRPFTGKTDPQNPLATGGVGAGNIETGVYREFQYSSQPPELPNRPPSHGQKIVDNSIYQSGDQEAEEEGFTATGPRLDPDGGD